MGISWLKSKYVIAFVFIFALFGIQSIAGLNDAVVDDSKQGASKHNLDELFEQARSSFLAGNYFNAGDSFKEIVAIMQSNIKNAPDTDKTMFEDAVIGLLDCADLCYQQETSPYKINIGLLQAQKYYDYVSGLGDLILPANLARALLKQVLLRYPLSAKVPLISRMINEKLRQIVALGEEARPAERSHALMLLFELENQKPEVDLIEMSDLLQCVINMGELAREIDLATAKAYLSVINSQAK